MNPWLNQFAIVRYRGFLLLEQPNHSWLVRPERSPMLILPFRTPICSIEEVKEILNSRLAAQESMKEVA